MGFSYPKTERIDHRDDYHGQPVADPYRWLEEPASTPKVRAWLEAQNELTFAYLEGLPQREAFRARLSELWNYPKRAAPFKKGGKYFQFRNSGLQNQDVLFVMDRLVMEGLADEGRVLLDPNALSEDGTVSLRAASVSPDGRHLAYAASESGSDWQTWRVRFVETGEDLPEALEHSKFSGATWLPDGSGFFYSVYPVPAEGEAYTSANENGRLLLHRLGSFQSADELVYQRPDEPKWMFYPKVSDDGRYLILAIQRSTEPKNLVYCRELGGDEPFKPLVEAWEAQHVFLGNDAETFYFQTDHQADRGRVVAIDLERPQPGHWREVVPEQADALEFTHLLGDEFLCAYLHHASHRLRRFGTDGEARGEIGLPTLGSVMEIRAERGDDEAFYSFTSFLFPTLPYRYDAKTGESQPLSEAGLEFDPEPFVTRQVFATSKDGSQAPMFLVHREGLELKGDHPTILYGYGGFNISLTPSFSVGRLLWLEAGGVLAVANLRGGGEYGKAWREAGTVLQKQNVFDDFIACAEHLIGMGVTSSEKLAIQGGSNGGLLVGAAMTQRPELFAAALPGVGVLDMLRFHKFTIGWAWVSDYGSADDPEQFAALLNYSPLHNVREGVCYPATLITTGDFDDRVVPAHSFKFAAALQRAQACQKPVLIRVQTNTGHGQGKPTRLLIEEQADIYAFLSHVLGMP